MSKPSTTNPVEPRYTVFVKVPFHRGTFVDPPATNWTTAKEAELWTLLNATPKGHGIDWDSLAERFDTTSSFLLQQAAWLYERQLSHVREHLSVKHVRQPSITAQTPPGSVGATAMKRAGSGQGCANARPPSSLSIRQKLSSELRREKAVVTPEGQKRVTYSRTTSATTITQFQRSPPAHMSPSQKPKTLLIEEVPSSPLRGLPTRSIEDFGDSSSSDEDSSIAQSRAFGRRPRFPPSNSRGKAILNVLASADEDSDEAPDFLPFPAQNSVPKESGKGKGKTLHHDGFSSTLRTSDDKVGAEKAKTMPSKHNGSASSSDTLSSPNQASVNHSFSSPRDPRSPGEGSRVLSALSPRHRKIAKDESEGTPSMGSSFSDLDDASISKSAMEEAMAREIKAGKGSLGVASRISGMIRHASNAGVGKS